MVDQEALQDAIGTVKDLVVAGRSFAEAIEQAAKEWDVPVRPLQVRIEKTGWTEDGLRRTAEATKAPTKAEELEAVIQSRCDRYRVPRSACIRFRHKDGHNYTAICRKNSGHTFVIAVRESDATVWNVRAVNIKETLS